MTAPTTPPRDRSALHALAALAGGVALGIVISAADPAAMRIVALVEPIGTMWVNAIRMTVIPLVVASLIVAVASAEPGMVGRLGTRAFLTFAVLLSVMALITALVAPPLFDRLVIDPDVSRAIRAGVAPVDAPPLPGFASWLVSIVPVNPVKAAADGAMLPLVVFSLAFGLALGRLLPASRDPVVVVFRGIADAMTLLVRWILLFTPVGVFVLALALAARLGSSIVGAVGFYVVAHSALQLLAVALLYLAAVTIGRMPLARFARGALPGQVVAMTTRSSMAALPAMLTSADRVLGVPRTVASFVLPLATSTFRINQAVTWVVVALFAGKLYGIALAPSQVATIAVTSVLMSFSVPGIPSASLFIIAPFLAGVGIPAEAIGVLIAVDLLPDIFKTLANVTGHLASLVLVTRGERRDVAGPSVGGRAHPD
jgi:proton glutamate symport protein